MPGYSINVCMNRFFLEGSMGFAQDTVDFEIALTIAQWLGERKIWIFDMGGKHTIGRKVSHLYLKKRVFLTRKREKKIYLQ